MDHSSTATPTPTSGFPSCLTTTFLQCVDRTFAQTEKFDALDCTILTVGETCVVGGTPVGNELTYGDRLGALTCVSENESVACLTGSLPACQLTSCSTGTDAVPMGVSEDCDNIIHGASCQAARAVGCESANHTELSCHAIGRLESHSAPPYPACEEEKYVDVATFVSSVCWRPIART